MNEATTTRSYLEGKRASLKTEINRLSEGLKHIEWVLRNVVGDAPRSAEESTTASPFDAITMEELSVLGTVEDCLVYMAERNDGEITSAEARRKLVGLEMIESDEVARSRIWEAFRRSTRFDKVERGRYRLVPQESDSEASNYLIDPGPPVTHPASKLEK